MNITLWIVQVMLALHTVMGAVWKFANSEQTVGSLKAIPHSGWLALSVIELLCAVGLIVPLFNKALAVAAPGVRSHALHVEPQAATASNGCMVCADSTRATSSLMRTARNCW